MHALSIPSIEITHRMTVFGEAAFPEEIEYGFLILRERSIKRRRVLPRSI